MASPQEPYAGLLKKISAVKLDTRTRTQRQNSERYKEATKNLAAILKRPNPWTDNCRYDVTKALNFLEELLSGEDLKEASVKDAHKAIYEIKRKLGIHKPRVSERGMPKAEYYFRDRTEGMGVHGVVYSTDKPIAPLQNIVTRRKNVETGISKEPKHNQMEVSGPPDDENFTSFLKEITSLIRNEQEHFSGKVLNWLKNRKNTEAMQALIESIVYHLSDENKELAQDNSNMKADILAIKKHMDRLGNEKDELILRLSDIVGAKLTENNPNIADLSDPNRPTKLSEQYIDIYDKEWIEAYEAMNKGSDMNEQQICLELLNVLLKAESECREMAKTQYEQLCSRCTSPAGPGENGQLESIHLSLINDLQKQTAKLSISSVQKKILKDNKVSMKSEVVKYQMKCVEICWYMSLQTPPMVLDKSLKEGQAFDSERYNWYTRKGKYVEFNVWPPLLLHKDGPLLGKGVAQVK